MKSLSVYRLGQVPYGATHELQKALQQARIRGEIEDTLLLLEHNPVVTLGRAAKQQNILLSEEVLQARGFEVHSTGRGGDVTYHGPGQLVAYPIIDLNDDRDVRKYVQRLEETMIRMAGHYDLEATRVEGMNGTWLTNPDRKIGAIGVRISRWVTMHGFAFNVNTDLSHFQVIIPCGITDKGVTSLSLEHQREVPMSDVEAVAVQKFCEVFGHTPTWHDELPEVPPVPSK